MNMFVYVNICQTLTNVTFLRQSCVLQSPFYRSLICKSTDYFDQIGQKSLKIILRIKHGLLVCFSAPPFVIFASGLFVCTSCIIKLAVLEAVWFSHSGFTLDNSLVMSHV